MRLGIFGGAFDPPHIGHINLALWLAESVELNLDEILIIPTGESPHKAVSQASYDDRLEMSRLAFGHLERFNVTDIERPTRNGSNPGKSYTVDTVRRLKAQYPPHTEFLLIIGSDMLIDFDKWKDYKLLLELCQVAAAARDNGNASILREHAARFGIKLLDAPVTPVSSTEIRNALALRESRGNSAAALLPEKVYGYIKGKKLYEHEL